MADQATGLLSGFLRRVRLRIALPYLTPPILDVGCGNGFICRHFNPVEYKGVDIDEATLAQARMLHPRHGFCRLDELRPDEAFNTIVLLAVIEHVNDPAGFLRRLATHLIVDGRIVLTTPHSSYDGFYEIGSRWGLFSRQAAQEHTNTYNYAAIATLCHQAGLVLECYQRFLFGANQLFVLKQTPASSAGRLLPSRLR